MAAPQVSIVIPVHNREKLVAEAIESAARQTLENIEIVVSDNCSTDRTWEVVQDLAARDRRIRAFRNESNLGPVLNWKRCIESAGAEFVKILFSDDWIDPPFVEKTLCLLRENDDAAFALTPARIHQPGRTWVEYDRLGRTGVHDLSIFVEDHLFGGERFPVSPGCGLFRKKDLVKNLVVDIPNDFGLDYRMTGAGVDLLLYLSCRRDYRKFCFVAEPLAHFRDHPGCLSRNDRMLDYYLGAKRFFVECEAGREYRDRFYSYILLRSISRGERYGRLLEGVRFRKAWGFMAGFLAAKYLRKAARSLRKKARKLGARRP